MRIDLTTDDPGPPVVTVRAGAQITAMTVGPARTVLVEAADENSILRLYMAPSVAVKLWEQLAPIAGAPKTAQMIEAIRRVRVAVAVPSGGDHQMITQYQCAQCGRLYDEPDAGCPYCSQLLGNEIKALDRTYAALDTPGPTITGEETERETDGR